MERLLIKNIAQIATPIGKKAIHGKAMNNIQIYKNAAIYCENGVIKLVDKQENILSKINNTDELHIVDANNNCVVPGFIDPHTHFLFGGTRANEFVSRLEGVPYLDLLKKGGGIVSTMKATRSLSEESLYEIGKSILEKMLKHGFTTIEGKSGYGLDHDTEIRMLRVMQKLDEILPITLKKTFLGAHAVPPEYKNEPEAYINFIMKRVLPEIADKHLADFCDVFCEEGVFSIEQSRKLLMAARHLGLKLKLHADELVSTGGAGLAADLDMVSADHLLAISDNDIIKLAKSNTIATLLPMTAFCMRKQFAPARRMMESGCAVSLASDFNPGSCYSYSASLILALAVINMKMTINEALTAITLNGAAALDMANTVGSIEVGKQADLLILDKPDYRFLVYLTGINIVKHVVKHGTLIF